MEDTPFPAAPGTRGYDVDEYTNRFLQQQPLHCVYRETRLGQPRLHAHDGYEWYLCLEGAGSFIAGDRVHPLSAGTLTMIMPHVLHQPRAQRQEPVHRMVLSVTDTYLDALGAASAPFASCFSELRGRAEGGSAHWLLPLSLREPIRQLLADLERELREERPHRELAAMQLLMSFLLQLGRFSLEEEPAVPRRSEAELLVQSILGYLAEHMHEELDVPRLCRQFQLSRSRLFELFRRGTGHTMSEYLTACRIHKARLLLAGSELPVTAIAGEVGYRDLSHFFHTFRKVTGMTPRQYREARRSGMSG